MSIKNDHAPSIDIGFPLESSNGIDSSKPTYAVSVLFFDLTMYRGDWFPKGDQFAPSTQKNFPVELLYCK